ncbi:MAG: hypothetical protein GY869_09260 [Planctomycetes bacterium]|nr:hypothetical protein [Planctomycetota bacterium]
MATVILAGGVVSVSALNSRCLKRTLLNQQMDRAWQLMDRQMTLIDAMGIETFVEQRITQGDMDDGNLIYTWEVAIGTHEIEGLYPVTMTVRWIRGNQPKMITSSTYFYVPPAEGDGSI